MPDEERFPILFLHLVDVGSHSPIALIDVGGFSVVMEIILEAHLARIVLGVRQFVGEEYVIAEILRVLELSLQRLEVRDHRELVEVEDVLLDLIRNSRAEFVESVLGAIIRDEPDEAGFVIGKIRVGVDLEVLERFPDEEVLLVQEHFVRQHGIFRRAPTQAVLKVVLELHRQLHGLRRVRVGDPERDRDVLLVGVQLQFGDHRLGLVFEVECFGCHGSSRVLAVLWRKKDRRRAVAEPVGFRIPYDFA